MVFLLLEEWIKANVGGDNWAGRWSEGAPLAAGAGASSAGAGASSAFVEGAYLGIPSGWVGLLVPVCRVQKFLSSGVNGSSSGCGLVKSLWLSSKLIARSSVCWFWINCLNLPLVALWSLVLADESNALIPMWRLRKWISRFSQHIPFPLIMGRRRSGVVIHLSYLLLNWMQILWSVFRFAKIVGNLGPCISIKGNPDTLSLCLLCLFDVNQPGDPQACQKPKKLRFTK